LRGLLEKVKNTLLRIQGKGKTRALTERYPQYKIGRGTYGDLTVNDWGENAILSIGNFTSIASGVQVFLGGEHRTDWVTTFPFNVLWPSAKAFEGHPKTKGNVTIGSDVWIGAEAIVLSGVTIGNGAVIGARSVVTKDVPPYAIIAGNPARVIKYRFKESEIDDLLRIAWWDWSNAKIEKELAGLLNGNIKEFLERSGADESRRE